ncbi:hypothetical protein N431DRAFT_358279 [Stipitochalara longipes BDJ]|nr:hypothetical protein N431DRAFT_358279 [Stipitochalara longipes BDJ]
MDGVTRFSIPTPGNSSKSKRYYWRNPEASIGEHYQNIKLGSKSCWEAIGDVRQKFEKIAPEIKTYLENHSDELAHPVHWTIYMIGRSPKVSAPTIMFCGKDKNVRIEVKETIKKSGIMDKYPGFRLGSCAEEFQHYSEREGRKRHKSIVQKCSGPPVEQHSPPDSRCSTPTLRDRPYITAHGDEQGFRNVTKDVEDRQQEYIEAAAGAGKAILYSPSDMRAGMRIDIQGFHGDSSSLRPATCGGFIYHQGSIYLTTVAHAFYGDDVKALPSSLSNGHIEFELDDHSDGEDDKELSSRCSASFVPSEFGDSTISGNTFSDTTSEFERSPMIVSATGHMINTSSTNVFSAQNSMLRAQTREPRVLVNSNDLLLLGSVEEHLIPSTTGRRPGLDYCLIEIEAKHLLKPKQMPQKFDQFSRPVPSGFVMSKPGDVDVVAATGSGGLLRGKMSETPSFLMLPGTTHIQEVWTVRHNRDEVFNGDCGAWVIDASNGNLFGHIVGGSPGLQTSYIIPARSIIDDLKDRFGGEWKPAGVIPEPVVRRSWYIKAMQSGRVKFLVGGSTFEVPHDLLVYCSTTFERSMPNDLRREITLPGVTKSTFESFLIWLYSFEQSLETENIDSAFYLAIFAEKYQIYDLRNQASNLIRAALHDRLWIVTPDILIFVYKVAPSDSSLRQLCFSGFVSKEGHHRSLDWEAAFHECPSLGWDYFQYKSSSALYHDRIETGGACRFHDHSNIDGWKLQEVIDCSYSFQTPLKSEPGRSIKSLATVGHIQDEASPALPSSHMDLSQYGRSTTRHSPASDIDSRDKKPRMALQALETRGCLSSGFGISSKIYSTGPIRSR